MVLAGYLTSQSLKEWKDEQVVTKRVGSALSHFLGIFSHFLGKIMVVIAVIEQVVTTLKNTAHPVAKVFLIYSTALMWSLST